jgi:hypothetical protein
MPERNEIRQRFWTKFLAYAKTKTKLHAKISPTQHGWLGTGAGIRGLGYNYAITQHEAYVELYIDRGKGSEEENLSIFRQLEKSKKEIEKVFVGPLEWQELKDRRASRIRITIATGGYRDDENEWPVVHEAMVNAMIRLEKALVPHIERLKV